MLFWIAVPVLTIASYFIAISHPNAMRGKFKDALWVAAVACFCAVFFFTLIGAIATGVSDKTDITTRFVDGSILTYQSDGSTVYSFGTKDNWTYKISGYSREYDIKKTTGESQVEINCGVSPDWAIPFNLGECSSTFWLNTNDLEK